MNLEQLIEKYAFANLKEEERSQARKDIAKEVYGRLANELKGQYNEKEIYQFAIMLARVAADADDEPSQAEFELFAEATGLTMSKNEFLRVAWKGNNEENLAATDELVDSLNKPAKEAALEFVALLLAADGKSGFGEKELLKRLQD